MFTRAKLSVLALMALVSTNVLADDGESFSGYENIVNELTATAEEVPAPVIQDEWAEVALHGGIAFAGSHLQTSAPNGVSGSGLLKGFELSAGANLFSKKSVGEIAYRDYSQEGMSQDLKAELKEIEARLIFLPPMRDKLKLRMGPGLAYRMLQLDARKNGKSSQYSSSTPTFLLLMGLERKISKSVSIGPDVAYRTPMGGTTIDNSGFDASLRLNATF